MHNGKLLQWDGWQTPEPTDVYDPAAQTFTTVNAPSSIFCSGNVQLPDGRIMTVGGYGVTTTGNQGLVDTNIFDPATQAWTRVANMHLPRWYPDLVELSDGRYVAISGNSTSNSTWADTPEVYDPAANTWTLLSKVSTSQVHEEEYPFSYLAPNGKVFTIGPSEDQSFFLDVNNQTWTPVGSSGIVNGSSVMYLSRKDSLQRRRRQRDEYNASASRVSCNRPQCCQPGLATGRLNEQRARLPHPHHAGRRPRSRRRRRGHQRPDPGDNRCPAGRDLGSRHREMDGRADRYRRRATITRPPS